MTPYLVTEPYGTPKFRARVAAGHENLATDIITGALNRVPEHADHFLNKLHLLLNAVGRNLSEFTFIRDDGKLDDAVALLRAIADEPANTELDHLRGFHDELSRVLQ